MSDDTFDLVFEELKSLRFINPCLRIIFLTDLIQDYSLFRFFLNLFL